MIHIHTVFPLYLSFTTIPERFNEANQLVRSILMHLNGFTKLYLNIPTEYKQFPNTTIDVSMFPTNDRRFELVRCKDYGPATKLIPTLEKLQGQLCNLIIFDDNPYHMDAFKILAEKQELNHSKSFSYYTYAYKNLKRVAQGVDMISFWVPHLKYFMRYYEEHASKNEYCFFVDDLVISSYLNKYGIDIETVPRKWKWAWIPSNESSYELFKLGGRFNRTNSMKECYKHL